MLPSMRIINLKSFLGVLLGVPFIFLIIYSGPSISIDYTNDNNNNNNNNNGYTDSLALNNQVVISSKSATEINSSILTISTNNFGSPTLQNGDTKWIEIIKQQADEQSDSPFQQQQQFSCNCDNQLSRMPFIPGEAVHDSERIIIFLITPTYTRPTQMADMTRLSQTLRLVPDIFWIVVEDAHNKSKNVEDLLRRTNAPYAHLLGPRPPTHMDKRSGRGVSNRLKAFEWLRENYMNTKQKGVIYFADDDNAYDVRLFEEMRDTQIVSMFPVGLISTLGLSTPIVSQKNGKIIGFHDPFIGRRKFAVDMAGFAVNLQFFLSQKKATMPYKVGYEEDYFLKSLGVKIWQLEPKAQNCTEVLVWHTKTKPADNPKMNLMKKVNNYNETNLPMLYKNVLQS